MDTIQSLKAALAEERRLCDLVAAALDQVMHWVEYEDGDSALAEYYATREQTNDTSDMDDVADYFNV